MARALLKLVGLALATAAAGGGLLWYAWEGDPRDEVIEEGRLRIEALENVAARLQVERRAAEVFVTRQAKDDAGRLETELLFVEIGPDGEPLPPQRFVLSGDLGYVEAETIRFERGFVREGDPLRGRSAALFTRLYGSATAPDQGQRVDSAGMAPRVYRGPAVAVVEPVSDSADPAADARIADVRGDNAARNRRAAFEAELWRDFWRLLDDPEYAESKGVRVAQVEAVATAFRPDRLYTVALEADGGLTVTQRPLEPVYRAAFAALGESPTTATTRPATAPAR